MKPQLGRIGLGCATFGREIDRDASFSVMDHAVANGVIHFDTAPAYGGGASETIIGEWLASRRPAHGTLLIATKLKPPYRPAAIAESLAGSRKRLRLGEFPLVYLHQWDDELDAPGAIEGIAALLPAHGVRALGVSNFDQHQLARMIERLKVAGLPGIVALQNNHNFAIRALEAGVLAVAGQADIAVVSYSPLGAGFLTGKHRGGVAGGSRFEIVPGHQKLYFNATAWERLARLENAAAAMSVTPALAALAWIFRERRIDCTLVGGRTGAQLEQALAARELAESESFLLPADE